ncbi:sugar phosphate isomerase/epimerase family protein [Sinomonas gamaensis]|uniref:sugar phosphate isomerase/epimerase family protein n=1 Tax=Sinomonas gamaensis TaxID=2565624 RepID=UPI0011081834|nr:sugar phosphate isomerase/epimerase family protein [Sinomonas gamaensis]
MKLGFYSACLPSLSPEEAIAVASQSGYSGVEWRVSDDVGDSGSPDFLGNNRCTVRPHEDEVAKVCEASRDAGLEVIALAPYIETGDLETVERLMAMAKCNDVPAVRLRAPWMGPEGFHALFDQGRAFFDQAAALAGSYGVKALLEIHQRSICPSASLARQMVGHLPPTRVGVIYDVGNLVVEGYEDHEMALQMLGPLLAHIHLKNAAFYPDAAGGPWKHQWTELDRGIVDVDRLLRLLQQYDYTGWISVEDFSTSRSDPDKLHYNSKYLRTRAAFSDHLAQTA